MLVLCAVALWLLWCLPDQPGRALAGVALVVMAHAFVLALECAMGAAINRADPVPAAGWRRWVGAWWQEVKAAPLVFAWRQPFRWRAWPDDEVPVEGAPTAVVFVHGFVCNRGLWLPWMKTLRARGIPYVSVNLEPVFGSIDDYCVLIEDAVRRAERLAGKPPVLVCHSMGGLAVRAWLAGQTDWNRVGRVITIGTPHRGTWLGRLSHVANGRQMRPDGAWLKALDGRELEAGRPPHERFICWYSNTDNIVFPASTATLPGADNRLLEGVAHVAMAYHPTVMDASLAEIRRS